MTDHPERRSTDTEVALLKQQVGTIEKGIEKIGREMDSFRRWRYAVGGVVALLSAQAVIAIPILIALLNRG